MPASGHACPLCGAGANQQRVLLHWLGRKFEVRPGQRYDLPNHMHWMLAGQPGGMGKYSHILSRETERSYAEDLKRNGYCDYLIAIIS
ncbi:MAG: hypothetical protein Q7U07_06940 [Gammaproteobacteria bacterium]|nr:hypothetical protein [Gammaproteobacteria bacterium]